ncbi:tail fiber domain-containing protein [bacterium]|nr:tail fiber domain-containing protein [bacterium]
MREVGTVDIANLLRVYGGSQIRGSETVDNYTNAGSDYLTNGGNVQVDPPSFMFGLYVQYSIRAAIVAFSDQRIKSNVVDMNDTTSLDQVRQLKPKYYEYVDKVKRGSSSVIGVLAQDVKEVLPRAVEVADGEIPNIYETATISSSNTVTFTNFNTSNLKGANCTPIAYLAEDKREEVRITEVVDEHTVRVEEDMSDWGGQLFVWGQKVEDFHHLNKDYIWTVATAVFLEMGW